MKSLRFLVIGLAFLAAAGFAFAAPLGMPKAASGSGMGLKFVLVSHGSSGDPFHSVVKQGMEDAAKLYGVSAQILMSEGDNAKEVALIEQAIAGNPDGIGISIVDPVAFDDVIQKAITKGIPVIAFNNDDSSTPNARLAYIGAAEKKVGYVLGKYMQQFLKKGDKIVIPEEVPGMSYAVNRSAGIIEAMNEIGVTAEELDAGYERAETTARISAYLLGHKDVKGVVNVGGLTTEVAGMVVQDLKLQGKVVVGGFDLLPQTGPAIKAGITKAVIDQQPYLQGFYTVVELAMMKFGKFAAFDIDTGRGIVNDKNINDVVDLAKRRIR
ncbi:MAG: substrate-binding domain-containing protein [Acidobacteria bacterium]|nr:substrate-binding domain-containing protein [Spirochaetota bacterium]MBE3131289.1 substrate-binding domain-containing protein [Acidobacteriota bacterium]